MRSVGSEAFAETSLVVIGPVSERGSDDLRQVALNEGLEDLGCGSFRKCAL